MGQGPELNSCGGVYSTRWQGLGKRAMLPRWVIIDDSTYEPCILNFLPSPNPLSFLLFPSQAERVG